MNGLPCSLHEISLTGAQVTFQPEHAPALIDVNRRYGLTIGVLNQALALGVYVRWREDEENGRVRWGLEIASGQTIQQA